MAGRHPVFEAAGLNLASEFANVERRGVERLVDVEIDSDASVCGGVEDGLDEAGGVEIKVGCAADQVDAGLDASANAARLPAPSGPVIGEIVSATSWMSISPLKCDLASCIATTFLAPKSPPTFT